MGENRTRKRYKNKRRSINEVSYAYAPSPHENDYDVVSKELVEKIVESIKEVCYES